MAVFRPVNRSHSYSYAPSFHDETRLMTMDFGFNICYETPSYLVTLSSHFTMANMMPIEMMQTARNTAQATQMGALL